MGHDFDAAMKKLEQIFTERRVSGHGETTALADYNGDVYAAADFALRFTKAALCGLVSIKAMDSFQQASGFGGEKYRDMVSIDNFNAGIAAMAQQLAKEIKQ